jgi:hypothetical protein
MNKGKKEKQPSKNARAKPAQRHTYKRIFRVKVRFLFLKITNQLTKVLFPIGAKPFTILPPLRQAG